MDNGHVPKKKKKKKEKKCNNGNAVKRQKVKGNNSGKS